MNLERVQQLVLYRYRYAIAYATLIVVSLTSLFFKLGELLPGVSRNEAKLALQNFDLGHILERGVYLPYNMLQWAIFQVFGTDAFTVRLASALFGIASLAMLFLILHLWHREKIAISIVVFMATSSWFLNYARYGGEEIYLVFSVTSLVLVTTLLRHYKHHMLHMLFAAMMLGLALYAPYTIYFLILMAILYRKEFAEIFRSLSPAKIAIGSIVFGITLLPLVYGFASDLDSIKLWLGWDGTVSSVGDFLANMNSAVGHVFWRSVEFPELHLGSLAMLDIFTATMIALGLYHYEQHFNLLRTRFIIYGFGLSVIVLGLSSDQLHYILLAPLLYMLAATGIITLLTQWNKIFPVNPFARMLGLLPMIFAIVITSNYHINRYFFAWAGNPPVKQAYSVEPQSVASDLGSAIEQKIALIYVPYKQFEQTQFLTFDYRRQIQILPIEEYSSQRQVGDNQLIYVHGSLDHAKPEGTTNERVIATDSKTVPIAYYVYSK